MAAFGSASPERGTHLHQVRARLLACPSRLATQKGPQTNRLSTLVFKSKRKDSEPRTKCLLNNAEITPHHPKDPVEMRRINFQTPGNWLQTSLSP